jgi:hypothetical protein
LRLLIALQVIYVDQSIRGPGSPRQLLIPITVVHWITFISIVNPVDFQTLNYVYVAVGIVLIHYTLPSPILGSERPQVCSRGVSSRLQVRHLLSSLH